MKEVLDRIDESSQRLARHAFFAAMKPEPDLRKALAFAPIGTFWVMTFQDIIRLNAERATDPKFRAMLEQHLVEDTGHQEWFLDDLRTVFGSAEVEARSIFSQDHRAVRDVSFELASEVFRIEDDRLRLVLIEVLEAAAGTYFSRIARFLHESGHAGRVKYFAGVHLEAEESHEIHEDDKRSELESIVLPDELREAAIALVDRGFAAFERMGDALVAHRPRAVRADKKESSMPQSTEPRVSTRTRIASEIPGPPGVRLLGKTGTMMRFFRDPIRIMFDLQSKYGSVASVSAGDPSLVCAFGPDLNRQVLSQPDLFNNAADLPIRIPRGSSLNRLTTFLVGMNGDQHRRIRRAMSPLFQKSQLEHHRNKIVEAVEASVREWPTDGTTLDLSAATEEIALRAGFRVLFDLDVASEAKALASTALGFTSGATSLRHILAPVPIPGFPYWSFLRLCDRLEQRLLELIADRRSTASTRHDALSILMSVESDGEKLPDALLVGLANELFIAGHQTTALTLAWTLFLLERHPVVLANLVDELTSVLKGDAPTVAQLDQLPYLDSVVKESMRLLSANAFLFFRKNQEPVQVGDYELPRGSSLVISPLITHHMPELFPDPNRFNPDRWKTSEPGPYEYLPFGAGPRMCLGTMLATVSVRVVIAYIVQRYTLELTRGADVSYQARAIMLGTKSGIPMHVHGQPRARVTQHPVKGSIHELVDLPTSN